MPATTALGAEVTNVLAHCVWILIDDEALAFPSSEFPWFKAALMQQIINVLRSTADPLYWPDLEVDLSVESIRHSKKFPPRTKSAFQPCHLPEPHLNLSDATEQAEAILSAASCWQALAARWRGWRGSFSGKCGRRDAWRGLAMGRTSDHSLPDQAAAQRAGRLHTDGLDIDDIARAMGARPKGGHGRLVILLTRRETIKAHTEKLPSKACIARLLACSTSAALMGESAAMVQAGSPHSFKRWGGRHERQAAPQARCQAVRLLACFRAVVRTPVRAVEPVAVGGFQSIRAGRQWVMREISACLTMARRQPDPARC